MQSVDCGTGIVPVPTPSVFPVPRSSQIAVALLLVAGRPAPGVSFPCRAPDTVIVPSRLAYLKELMSQSDSGYKEPRDSLGFSSQNANKVKLETNVAKCQSGVNALNAILETPGQTRAIWLFALGNGWAIVDPDIPPVPGQPDPLFFFGTEFNYKGTLFVL